METSAPARVDRGSRLVRGAVALWVAFVLTHWALNGRWWVWLVPAALPPLLFVVVPLALVVAAVAVRPRRRSNAALAVLGLLLGLPYGGLRPVLAVEPEQRGIRILSWNTEFWTQDKDPDQFYRYLHEQDADVYLLQEYLGWDLARPIDGQRPIDDLDRLRAEFPEHTVVRRGELVTLSRLPVVAQPPVAPDPAAAGDATTDFDTIFREAKALRTDLRVDGSVVSFYNVHIAVQLKLVNPVSANFWRMPRTADPQRRRQLAGLWADISTNPRPVMLAGDFNTSPAMADLDGAPRRLRDANDEPYPATWPARLPLWRLDWAFTSAPLRVDGYDLRSPDGLSDHRAQVITLAARR
ncbi:endonuclease/exonuclease/phosphatase family protein [Micromonospora sp. WMMD737]|uniref:endonuclease/exonuclease/phosphatase family protein n=1 Tax=Micromonospora sp. WMMD737 TaxID=3404113 RepID=UPI003B95C092